MSFFVFPEECIHHTLNFLQPARIISEEIKTCEKQLLIISLANTTMKAMCSKRLIDLSRINELVAKYSKYNDIYLDPKKYWFYENPKGNPHLLDALYSGCKLFLVARTFESYNPEMENDIKDIVKLTPQSINCIIGSHINRNEVPPLAAACFNVKMPLHIVEFLLQQGANPNATLKTMNGRISIFEDLKQHVGFNGFPDLERITAIKALFIKYGAKIETTQDTPQPSTTYGSNIENKENTPKSFTKI